MTYFYSIVFLNVVRQTESFLIWESNIDKMPRWYWWCLWNVIWQKTVDADGKKRLVEIIDLETLSLSKTMELKNGSSNWRLFLYGFVIYPSQTLHVRLWNVMHITSIFNTERKFPKARDN